MRAAATLVGLCAHPLLGSSTTARAASYYVSPAGNDANNGKTPATAWKRIDRGDQLGVLLPGDTVNIFPGTYSRTTSVLLTLSGTAGNPIVYRRIGRGPAVVDLNNASQIAIEQNGSYVELHGLTITRVNDHGIESNGEYCLVEGCRILGVSGYGLRVQGNYGTFVRNVVYQAQKQGIKQEDGGKLGGVYHHNVVYEGADHGIELSGQVKTARLFNNIVAQNAKRGISGPVENRLGFNNVWGNPDGNLVGVVDSAGGISRQPRFVNPALGRFDLKFNASELNAGLDLGYPFNGSAPDMGAVEKYNAYFVGPAGDDSADGRSVSTAWASIDNGDTLLLPGDTVYVLPGVYADSVVIHDAGEAGDLVSFIGERDATSVDAAGFSTGVHLLGSFIHWRGVNVSGADSSNIQISAAGCVIEESRITGSGQIGLSARYECELRRDVFADNAAMGVWSEGGKPTAAVYNSTFYNNGAYGYYATGDSIRFVNNIFVGHSSAGVHAGSASSLTYSIFHDNAFAAVGGVVVGFGSKLDDPDMIDPGADDFRLASSSPAIDAGTDVGSPYLGSAPDMGAYESGALVSMKVEPLYDSLLADSSYAFTVVATDENGAPASYGTLTWSHTFATGSISPAGVFAPQGVGAGRIIARTSINGMADTTAPMNVVPGALYSIAVSPDRDTISADSTRQFSVAGFDRKGNPVTDVGTINWNVVEPIGGIDAAGLFSAGRAGAGFVRATSSKGPVDQSDTIVVVPGRLVWLDVVPSSNAVIEDSSFQYAAHGYDADTNFVADLTGSAAWSTDDPGGSVTPGGLYTAGPNPSPPGFYVFADSGSMHDSGRVTVLSSGALAYVRIELYGGAPLGDTTLTTDMDTTRLYCRGYSSGDSLLGDVSVSWTLIGADTVGSLSPATGNSTVLELTRPGTGRIVAKFSDARVDTSGLITCGAGLPARLRVTPDSAAITADDSVQFAATSFDEDGNLSDPAVTVGWSVTGEIGTIDGSGRFRPGKAGSGSIIAAGAGLADTARPVVVVAGALARLAVTPDSTVVSADSTRQFTVTGYDAHDNPRAAGNITWSLTAPLGTIDAGGVFDPVSAGTARVVAASDLGVVDTSRYLQVVPGKLASLRVSPDTLTISTDGTALFTATGEDSEGNTTAVGTLAWVVIGGIGEITAEGLFNPNSVGSGRIAATSSVGGATDTTGSIEVTPGALDRLRITPDTAVAIVGDTLHFTADGLDADFNPTPVGSIGWAVNGGIGSIDSTGALTVTTPGTGAVTATSSLGGITDTTGNIYVEALSVTATPLGTVVMTPAGDRTALLAFRVANPYFRDKQIGSLTVHDAGRGPGTPAERLANIDSVFLYLDVDGDWLLTVSDSLIAAAPVTAGAMPLSFAPVTIAAGTGRDFLAALKPALYARDGDSLDLRFAASADLGTVDGTSSLGGTINSFGFGIVDGMTVAQIGTPTVGLDTLVRGPGVDLAAIIDLPRNGYQTDTLKAFSLSRDGSVAPSDFDSLILYKDGGDGVWGGAAAETRLGRLVYTGNRWSLTGLSVPLAQQTVRFFVGARLAPYASSNAVIHFHVPLLGIEMASGNDGPIDAEVHLPDSMVIRTDEALALASLGVTPRSLVPGLPTGPLWGVRCSNNSGAVLGLDSLRVHLVAVDPAGASQAQLDSQIDSLFIYLNRDGDPGVLGPADSLLATARVSAGAATFSISGLTLAASGGQAELTFAAALSGAKARNGNSINLRLVDSTDVFTATPIRVSGSFPLQNGAAFTIDAFPAARITSLPLSAATFYGGQTRRAALQFTLPSNGYATDTLRSLRLRNAGTLIDPGPTLTVKLWRDRTGNGLSADDTLLKVLAYGAPYWEATAINAAIGPAGLPLVVTVDVADRQFEGGTLKFQVPTGGVEYRSGTIGPDDIAFESAASHLVLPANRVTAISVPAATVTTAPGTPNNVIFTFALYNGYVGQSRTLQSLRLTNASRTRSTPAQADFELGQVALYLDADRNRLLNSDSLLATGFFAGGALHLSGLGVSLAPESLSYFFVVADLPLAAIDGDSLAVALASPSDLTFSQTTTINGDLPLSSGAYLVIDGSVADQYEVLPVAGRTMVPGDTSILVLAFKPAQNGDQVDTLRSLTVTNAQTADSSDIALLELWQDQNGDGAWQSSDVRLSAFAFAGGAWTAPGLSVEIAGAPPTLFVVADVAAAATPDAEFEAVLGLGACQYASANDGPRDLPLPTGQVFTVSNSGLRIAAAPTGGHRSVGQNVTVRATVTNILGSAMDSVLGAIAVQGDASAVALDSAGAGPVSLSPGQSTDFVWYYTAVATGTVTWDLQALAPQLPDSSARIRTAPTTVQNPPGAVQVKLVNSIPAAVTRGQQNVYPLSLTYAHPDPGASAASLRLDSLQLTFTDGAGVPEPANAVASRLVLSSGYKAIATVTAVPAASAVWLRFTEPVILDPGAAISYSLLLDIDSSAGAQTFALALANAAAIPLADHNTGAAVGLSAGVAFPMRTASCRIDDPSRQMAVSYRSLAGPRANLGQSAVDLVRMYVRHPGPSGSSQIQLSGLTLSCVDTTDLDQTLSGLLTDVRLTRGGIVLGQANGSELETTLLNVALGLPITLAPNQIDSFDIEVAIAPLAALPRFGLRIRDSSDFVIRDLSSGSPLSAGTDTVLAAGLVFPIASGWVELLEPAAATEACMTSRLPFSIVGGVDSLDLFTLTLSQPAAVGQSPVQVREVKVHVVDSLGDLLDPRGLFDRIGYRLDGAAADFQPFVDLAGGAAVFRMADSGLTIAPGETVELTLVADIEPDAPYDHFGLELGTQADLFIRDASDSTRQPGVVQAAGCAESFPFVAGYTRIFLPAGRPALAPQPAAMRLARPGQPDVDLLTAEVSYLSAAAQADVALAAFHAQLLQRTPGGLIPAPASAVFTAVRLSIDGAVLAIDSLLATDSIRLVLVDDFAIATGDRVTASVRGDLRSTAPLGNYVLRLADSTCLELADRNLDQVVYPVLAGAAYPLFSADLAVAAGTLEQSFSNYPNPFNPSRAEFTTFRYNLPEDAYVDLELYTITGQHVRTLVSNDFRAAGSYSADTWSGANQDGREVVPGTYFARITARYTSGATETYRRKVAVLR